MMRFFKPDQDKCNPETDNEKQSSSIVDEIVQGAIECKRAKEEREEKYFQVIQQISYMV